MENGRARCGTVHVTGKSSTSLLAVIDHDTREYE
jgi:hypothetical protein